MSTKLANVETTLLIKKEKLTVYWYADEVGKVYLITALNSNGCLEPPKY